MDLSESECPGVEVSWKAIPDRSGWRGGSEVSLKGPFRVGMFWCQIEVDGEESQG